MPTQPQRLLDLAAQLFQREPWDIVDERSIFLVRVPGREHPVTITIFGDTVDVHGIEIGLGPDGFRRLAKLHSPETTDAEIDAFRPGDALSLVFLPPGQIPPEYRKIWKAAAFRPSGGRPAPQFAANNGGENLRPIKRSEGTIIGYCVHAVLDALDQHLLVPPDVASGDEIALELTVPGSDPDAFEEDDLPPVEANIVSWPGENGALPPSHQIAASTAEALTALPLGAHQLAIVGFKSKGAADQNIPEGAFALALFAPEASEFLATVALESDELSAIEGGMLALLSATTERPEQLLTDTPQVALALFPMSRQVGISPRFGQFHSGFAALVDDTVRELGGTPAARLDTTLDALDALGGVDVPHEFPSSLDSRDDWEQAFAFTSGALLFEAQDGELLDGATQKYWGSRKTGVRTVEVMGSLGASTAFLHYAFEDYAPGADSPTATERLIAKAREHPDISAGELACYEARRDVTVSIFEVSPDGPDVTDVLTGEEFTVDIDPDNLCRFAGHILALRRYRLGPFHAFAIAGFPLESVAKEDLLDDIRCALDAEPTHALLRSQGHVLGSHWHAWMTKLNAKLKGRL
jgi:hypothetical protein